MASRLIFHAAITWTVWHLERCVQVPIVSVSIHLNPHHAAQHHVAARKSAGTVPYRQQSVQMPSTAHQMSVSA